MFMLIFAENVVILRILHPVFSTSPNRLVGFLVLVSSILLLSLLDLVSMTVVGVINVHISEPSTLSLTATSSDLE